MPKRTDIKSILIIGAGPIVIGQACEFDYSGVQACKALKEEGYRVILVNSNPATIMTDPGLADATYIEPITPEVVAKIIAKERPDALLPTMGGQTALNTAMKLADDGTLEKYGVEMIAAKRDVIAKAEDRLLFRDAMDKIGLDSPKSRVVRTLQEARDSLDFVGLPAIIRPSFTLAGTGGGIAYNIEEYETIVSGGLAASPVHEVLVEESVLGWKEYEMEVVRDKKDNCIIICSIENVDPMGVHTGDSITVAPALTLTDKEYQIMRNASLAVLREIGVDTGGSNVQFAVNPKDGRMTVIEMNPRVSRSSALASKATGFPIAKVAAKLAVGYTLDELANDITGVTPASFEPTIDYVVTKIPRFTFEKFPGADPNLTTSMKSVGEAMAIGRTFQESLQKGLRSMETGLTGMNEVEIPGASAADRKAAMKKALATPRHDRLLVIAQAFRLGLSVDEIHAACSYDKWFLEQIKGIVDAEEEVRAKGLPIDAPGLLRLKKMGFSDQRLSELSGKTLTETTFRREVLNVKPVFKRIDTCAAEFPSSTAYMYSCYEGDGINAAECEADVSDRDKVIILGGGPNRIGQGIEFDYCCVHAAYALDDAGKETIMVNCNPETVSTDYDTSDRLYFEPLTAETVIELVRKEQSKGRVLGCIVQFGGQTPLKLAHALEDAGIPILGTSPDSIDLAEDRERFQGLLHELGLKQPPNGTARSLDEAKAVADRIGYPVVIRPSFVLGGRAMQIVYDHEALERYMKEAVVVSGKDPVLIDFYLKNAIEVDVDALADGTDVFVAGIMQHIEEAGIHSGDSACFGQGARRARPDERAICGPGRGDLHPGSQSARQPHRALRRQGHRHSHRQDRRPDHGRRVAGQLQPQEGKARPCGGEGSSIPLRPFPRRRHPVGAGNEIHRRSHGHRQGFRPGLRQGPIGRRHRAADRGLRVHLGARGRQAGHGRGRPAIAGHGLQADGHRRHGPDAPRCRLHRPGGQQGAGGSPALRRCHDQRPDPVGGQHHRGQPGGQGFVLDPPLGLAIQHPALHHGGRGASGSAGHRRLEARSA
ncbi:MAG: carbamoyl-phosphate synthase large subunit [Stygiobacter sp.]|nr:MAG: carbamoyl-phosphate synthase large subunit [Stygiobacter sp.]